MPLQDHLTKPPFNSPLLDSDGNLTSPWRQWFEQMYEWEAPDPVAQLGMHFPLFPTIDVDTSPEVETQDMYWIKAVMSILKRLESLEVNTAMLEATTAHRGLRNVKSSVTDYTDSADRAMATVYQNTDQTTRIVHFSGKIT